MECPVTLMTTIAAALQDDTVVRIDAPRIRSHTHRRAHIATS